MFFDLAYSEHDETEMSSVFAYANELGFEPGINSPEVRKGQKWNWVRQCLKMPTRHVWDMCKPYAEQTRKVSESDYFTTSC